MLRTSGTAREKRSESDGIRPAAPAMPARLQAKTKYRAIIVPSRFPASWMSLVHAVLFRNLMVFHSKRCKRCREVCGVLHSVSSSKQTSPIHRRSLAFYFVLGTGTAVPDQWKVGQYLRANQELVVLASIHKEKECDAAFPI